jgi:hypothetical protein
MHDEPLPAGRARLEERENSRFGQNISDSSGSLFNDQINNRVIRNILQVIRVSCHKIVLPGITGIQNQSD